ncbi:hypothetical protein ACFZBE_40455 [Streptomyces sp. NPDC008061]|uniref:hypothetical protein n=1 Tax=Streptomyces sp. NPDC008061 TaxID=3364805 RepID=UPI0036E05F5B
MDLNALLQKENAHEVEHILDFALERRRPCNSSSWWDRRRVFRVDGIEVDAIPPQPRLAPVGHGCTCLLRSQCIEGFWALRVDHNGGIQPCLLRDDLRLNVTELQSAPERLVAAVAGHVTSFTEGTL